MPLFARSHLNMVPVFSNRSRVMTKSLVFLLPIRDIFSIFPSDINIFTFFSFQKIERLQSLQVNNHYFCNNGSDCQDYH